MKIHVAENYRGQAIALLNAEKLPTEDLHKPLENFFVIVQDGRVIGVVGLEIYDNYGLLRSLVVNKSFRNLGVANKLVRHIELLCGQKSINEIYLLTETTQDYFSGKGYKIISRANVPVIIQLSAEFSHLCPQSAIVMKKILS